MASVKTRSASKKTRKVAPPRNTRQRIILRAIALFNRYGIQNVAVERIASDLKMSPGNLTYHFKRKDDLIEAALALLMEHLGFALQRPEAVQSPQDGAEYLIRLFRTFWEFRFFFNSLAYLLTDDRRMSKQYAEFSQQIIQAMETDITYLAEREYFRPAVAPNTFRLLSENMWSQLLHWLRMQQIQSPSAPTPSDEAIYDAALHIWSLCHPWMNPFFADELLRVFQDLLFPRRRRNTQVDSGPPRVSAPV
jgi:AcrR family transcriptional regulator